MMRTPTWGCPGQMRQVPMLMALAITVVVASCAPAREAAVAPTPQVTTARTFNPLNHPTIGIYLENLSGQRLVDGVLRTVEDEFMRTTMQQGYSLAARSDLDRVAREQRIQGSKFTEEAVARVGRALNVSAIIIVSINELATSRRPPPVIQRSGRTYYRTMVSVSARMVGAERADVLWMSTFSDGWNHESTGSSSWEHQPRALQHVAGVVAAGLPPRRSGR